MREECVALQLVFDGLDEEGLVPQKEEVGFGSREGRVEEGSGEDGVELPCGDKEDRIELGTLALVYGDGVGQGES